MTKKIGIILAGFACTALLCTALPCTAAPGAQAKKTEEKTKVLILVGGHGYDEEGFNRLWSGLDGVASQVFKGAPYSAFDDVSDFNYDAIVMFNLSSGMSDAQKKNFLKLLDRGVGLVVWHHALANCQDWPEFEKIAGGKFWLTPGERGGVQIPKSGTGFGIVKMHIEDPDHPITRGITDFTIEDEPYNHQTFGKDIHILVKGDHPLSDKPIAWVHDYGKARVLGYQSGHDSKAWTNESFQRLLTQGIHWVARRPADD